MTATATALDKRFRALAKTLLSKRGRACTFYPIQDDTDGSAYDVNTGTIPDGDGVAIKTNAVFVLLGAKGRSPQDRSAEGVRQEDHFMYVPAIDFSSPPKAADKVIFDNENAEWRVLAVTFLYSGELTALYGVYLKKP